MLVLACPENCYRCSSAGFCSQCVNSSHSPSIYLHSGSCISQCPVSTYTSDSQCLACHISCLSCSGPSLTQCLSCPSFFFPRQVNTSSTPNITLYSSICASVCGEGKFMGTTTGVCQECEINCLFCITDTYCHVCKQGASEVGVGVCDFTLCAAPCSRC